MVEYENKKRQLVYVCVQHSISSLPDRVFSSQVQ